MNRHVDEVVHDWYQWHEERQVHHVERMFDIDASFEFPLLIEPKDGHDGEISCHQPSVEFTERVDRSE